MEEAEISICRYEQQRFLSCEIDQLLDPCKKKKDSPLRKIDPIYTDGILRVGFRLDRAYSPFSAKHPAIVPSKSSMADLIERYYHYRLGHLSKELHTD